MKKLDASALEAHKQRRLDHKSACIFSFLRFLSLTRHRGDPLYQPHQEEIPPETTRCGGYVRTYLRYATFPYTSTVDGASAAPASKRPNVQMPDEYLPPNKILFLQNLPETVTKER